MSIFRSSVLPVLQALAGPEVSLAGLRLELPFPRAIRLSLVLGNRRVHRLIAGVVRRGDTVVDVGAHIGYTALYAATLVGPTGRVLALEPTPDNLAVLRRNHARNVLPQLTIRAVAAGRTSETRDLFVRGDVSAVNSLFPESFYAPVTDVSRVVVERLDDVVDSLGTRPRLVKIDVEGGELDVLAGMPRLLRAPELQLIVEWHPVLQVAAGQAADALPRALWDEGFTLRAASHLRVAPLTQATLPGLVDRLTHARRPIEILASRTPL